MAESKEDLASRINFIRDSYYDTGALDLPESHLLQIKLDYDDPDSDELRVNIPSANLVIWGHTPVTGAPEDPESMYPWRNATDWLAYEKRSILADQEEWQRGGGLMCNPWRKEAEIRGLDKQTYYKDSEDWQRATDWLQSPNRSLPPNAFVRIVSKRKRPATYWPVEEPCQLWVDGGELKKNWSPFQILAVGRAFILSGGTHPYLCSPHGWRQWQGPRFSTRLSLPRVAYLANPADDPAVVTPISHYDEPHPDDDLQLLMELWSVRIFRHDCAGHIEGKWPAKDWPMRPVQSNGQQERGIALHGLDLHENVEERERLLDGLEILRTLGASAGPGRQRGSVNYLTPVEKDDLCKRIHGLRESGEPWEMIENRYRGTASARTRKTYQIWLKDWRKTNSSTSN